MKKLLFASLTLSLVAALFASPASAAELSQGNEPCPNGTPISVNSECLPFGSYTVLQRMLETGKFFFDDPLPATSPDPTLTQLTFYYARVNSPNAPVFATPEDAAAGKPVASTIAIVTNGLAYVTYSDVREIGGKNYYMI